MPHKGRTAVSWPRRVCRGLHRHGGTFQTAAPNRYPPDYGCRGKGSGQPPRRTNTGPIRRGVSDKTTSLRGQAEQRRAHKSVANGGIAAEELSDPGFEPRQPGAPWDRRQLHRETSSSSAVPPFVPAHCFRVSPDPGDSWSTAMGSGRRHRQILAGAARRENRVDLALRRTPRATVGGMRGVFSCGFPRLG